MENQMFCFQCEQTAGCNGCTGHMGVCGKTSNTAKLQDKLTGALIGLARASDGSQLTADTHRALLEGLSTTVTNVNFNDDVILEQIESVTKEKNALIPLCRGCAEPCGRNDDYDMEKPDYYFFPTFRGFICPV